MKKTVIFLFSIFCMFPTHAQKIVWEKTFERSSGCCYHYISLQLTSDGGFVMMNDSLGDLNFNKNNISKKDSSFNYRPFDYIFISKFNEKGEFEWKKKYIGSYSESINDFKILKNGGYVFTGITPSENINIYTRTLDVDNCLVVKLAKNEKIAWEKKIGGSQRDYFTSILPTEDGGYILAGVTKSSDGDVRSGNKGGFDLWVVKLTSKGEILWEKTYGGSLDDGRSVKILSINNGYILGASTKSSDGDVKSGNKGDNDAWIIEIDKKGNLIWEKTYGGSRFDVIGDLQPTEDGGYIVVGGTEPLEVNVPKDYYNGWIFKIDSRGEMQWEKCFGGSQNDIFKHVKILPDGGFIVGGETFSSKGDIKKDKTDINTSYWLLRMDKEGNVLNQRTFGMPYNRCQLKDLQLCKDGGIILVGTCTTTRGYIKTKGWILKVKY